MPVARKKNPNLLLWGLLIGIAFFGFGLQCFLKGMTLALYGVMLPQDTFINQVALLAGFIGPVLLMMIGIGKLIRYRL